MSIYPLIGRRECPLMPLKGMAGVGLQTAPHLRPLTPNSPISRPALLPALRLNTESVSLLMPPLLQGDLQLCIEIGCYNYPLSTLLQRLNMPLISCGIISSLRRLTMPPISFFAG